MHGLAGQPRGGRVRGDGQPAVRGLAGLPCVYGPVSLPRGGRVRGDCRLVAWGRRARGPHVMEGHRGVRRPAACMDPPVSCAPGSPVPEKPKSMRYKPEQAVRPDWSPASSQVDALHVLGLPGPGTL